MERTLSKNEARLVLDLEWRRQRIVTLAEIREALDASDGYARYLAHRLVRKGWLERLKPGLFRLIPAERGREGAGDSNPLAVAPLLVQPYFFSFGTACTHHGLTEQTFSEVYVACRERKPARVVLGKRYVFVHVREERFFGSVEAKVLGETVRMATPERALLDAVHRPRYAGGIGEVAHIVGRAATRVSWEDLLAFARRWGESAIVQRLGYLLDLHRTQWPPGGRGELLGLVRPKSKIHLGPRRRWGASGHLVRPWNVVANVPAEVLGPAGGAPAGARRSKA